MSPSSTVAETRPTPTCMSYDLAFWKQESPLDAEATYHSLVEEKHVTGAADLPIDIVLVALRKAFPNSVREPCGPNREWVDGEEEGSGFQITWSSQHVLMTLRPLNKDLANRMIDVMADFECSLYDPQENERFD